MRKLAVCLCAILLAACTKGTEPTITMSAEKEHILEMLENSMFESCAYKGRINIKYNDGSDSNGLRAIVNKDCSGYMEARLLGPFGVTVAEIVMIGDSYTVQKDDKDLTQDPRFRLNMDDLLTAKQYMQLPPPKPDYRYTMTVDKSHYLFTLGDSHIVVSSDYKVVLVVEGDHTVGYEWAKDGELKTMIFSRGAMALDITFSDKWIRQ